MRILWLDQTSAPWKQADGWDYIKRFAIDFVSAQNSAEARELLRHGNLELAVINADVSGGLDLVADAKSGAFGPRIPVILVSARWGKKDFKAHSLAPGAADNYARLPMPVSGFLDVVRSLTGQSLEEKAEPQDSSVNSISIGLNPTSAEAPADDASLLLERGLQAGQAGPPPRSPIDALKAALKAPWRKGEGAPLETPSSSEPPETIKPLPQLGKADAEVLKKYLSMREQELEHSLREKARLERNHEKISAELEALKVEVRDLERKRQEAEGKAERIEKRNHEQDKQLVETRERAGMEKESLLERIKLLERELEESRGRYGSLKDRVRRDIRKIQTREKELETRLELLKRDSETLIGERDRQVLELRRKIDALEFDLDLIQDRKIQAENNANRYVDKLARVARTLDLAVAMLAEDEPAEEEEDDEIHPVVGGAITVNELLKNPVQGLSNEELVAAEAPTKIFNKDEVADELLARSLGDGEADGGNENAGNDFDQALGS